MTNLPTWVDGAFIAGAFVAMLGGVVILSRKKKRQEDPTPSPNPTWGIGPTIRGKNYSVNMPAHPQPHPEGWAIDLPQPNKTAGHLHEVSFVHGPLTGKSRIVLRYRIEMANDTKIVPTNFPDSPATLSLYFQRKGDDWSARGVYETYRWYSSQNNHIPITAGEHELIVGFDENWTAVLTSSAETNLAGFLNALNNAERVGIVLGGGDGLAHGVYATGPARLVVTEFTVE